MADLSVNTLHIPDALSGAAGGAGGMSYMTIKADPAVMEAKASQVLSAASRMMSEYEDMTRVVERTAGYWNGEAAELHRKRYRDMQTRIQSIFQCLEEHAANLQEIAALYTATETNIKVGASQLPKNAIE